MTRSEALRLVVDAVRDMQERARADGFEDRIIDEALSIIEDAPLETLSEKFPLGLRVAFQAGDRRRIATILGYCYSLPKTQGGPEEPALVGDTFDGLVNIYPDEVIAQEPLNR